METAMRHREPIRACHDGPELPWRERGWTVEQAFTNALAQMHECAESATKPEVETVEAWEQAGRCYMADAARKKAHDA
jgi:hypothetical protein